jgi:hypothetical protein
MGVQGFYYEGPDELGDTGVMRGVQSCLTFGLAMTLGAVYADPAKALTLIDKSTDERGHEDTLRTLLDRPETFGALKPEPCCAALPDMPASAVRQMVMQLQMFRMVYVSMLSGR